MNDRLKLVALIAALVTGSFLGQLGRQLFPPVTLVLIFGALIGGGAGIFLVSHLILRRRKEGEDL